MNSIDQVNTWKALKKHHQEIADLHMRQLFDEDPHRFERFSLRLGEILFDFSKNRVIKETLTLLCDLARQAELAGWIEAMFAGEKINLTEDRAVLHIALRNRSSRSINVDGQDVMPKVNRVLEKMRAFSELVRGGETQTN